MKYTLAVVMIGMLAGCASIGGGSADIVTVDIQGKVFLNGKPVPVKFLSDRIKKDTLIIDAHTYTPQAKLSAIVKEAEDAGVKKVTFKADEAPKSGN